MFRLSANDIIHLVAYSDANYVTSEHTEVYQWRDTDNQRWTSHMVFSKAGDSNYSTTEAEYIAAYDAAKEVVWARILLEELHINQPTVLCHVSKNSNKDELMTLFRWI